MTKSFNLILESGPNSGTEYPLEKEELYLGRDVNNDIVINDAEVSRRHARLVKHGDDYYFEDMGSTNGTFILGQRLSGPVLLTTDTEITIGERVQLRYVAEVFDPSATVISPRRVPQPPEMNVPPAQPQPVAPAPMTPVPPASVPPTPPTYIPPQFESADLYPPVTPGIPPSQPVSMNLPPAQVPAKKKSKTGIILLIILGVLLVFCVVPWIIVDLTNSWCSLFPGLFNMLQAGAC